ncbi:diaminopropionate ammonia-lyase [Labrys wisconsinensis]|uniref:Diaminopropionate ammonia-lyase n=1 Tax=Labrys wisconsinensis TaxID=425677 RepID=A0ABU0JIJ6_9HYPH|nr:diaminopropionate ammonia-lyase [Labrys wisconsinensis]MDQ0474087.1 diaminopropionate ammonia-lyase [Labrys wisconsinensis]
MTLILNALPRFREPLSAAEREFVGEDAPQQVRPFLALWGRTDETPLLPLPEIAGELGLGGVVLKDEGLRLGQGSFKSLGGAYALMVLFRRLLERHLGQDVRVTQLLSPTARAFARSVTVCCATDGNHGKSVAAGARLLGCRSVIFIHQGVSRSRAEAIGADEIVRVEGTYDLSVSEAERVSGERGWLLVSDTSWPGYEEIPALVGQGYTILAEEALRQADGHGQGRPTHVFLQAGVGGFASSIAGYLTERLGRDRLKVVVVEPDRAACLFGSAGAGELVTVPPTEPTIMAMLECYRPSLIAWRILEKLADGFMTVTEEQAKDAMRRLAGRDAQTVVAGESGAAGLAGLVAAATDREMRAALGLGPGSRVLLINTETATDPASYGAIVGRPPAAVAGPRTAAERDHRGSTIEATTETQDRDQ